jgi:hypothetical protein
MPVPVDLSRFIDDIASMMLNDILKSPSPEEMGQLIEELETRRLLSARRAERRNAHDTLEHVWLPT